MAYGRGSSYMTAIISEFLRISDCKLSCFIEADDIDAYELCYGE